MFRIGPRPTSAAAAAVFVLAAPVADASAAAKRVDKMVPGAVSACAKAGMDIYGTSVRRTHWTSITDEADRLAALVQTDLRAYHSIYAFGFSRGANVLLLGVQRIPPAAQSSMRVVVLVDLPRSAVVDISLPVRPTVVYSRATPTPRKTHYALENSYAVGSKFTPKSKPRNVDGRTRKRGVMLDRVFEGESPRTHFARTGSPQGL